jgi:hypothetical protein
MSDFDPGDGGKYDPMQYWSLFSKLHGLTFQRALNLQLVLYTYKVGSTSNEQKCSSVHMFHV